jgi:hypothetical protein
MLDMTRARKRRIEPSDAWAALLNAAKAVRTTVVSNRPKRAGSGIAPFYDMYYALVQEAINKIEEASRLTLDADGTPVTPRDITERRGAANAKRLEDGRPLLAECRPDAWWTWISPAQREELTQAVAKYYDAQPNHRGKRFTPFVTDTARRALRAQAYTLHDQIDAHRSLHRCEASKADPSYVWADTRYSALQLAACAAAQKELRARTDGAVTAEARLPKDWRMLCPDTLRARLREADANPPAARLMPEEEHVWMPPAWVKPE